MLFCEVYEALDPGCCVLAIDSATQRLMGSCFYHPRPTHVSLGIMNVHDDFFGQGVARKLLAYVTELADEQSKPVRLVSSAMNLDSFSLYSKAGFQPIATFQDMILTVPEQGIELPEIFPQNHDFVLRDATITDVESMVELELKVAGIDRAKDFRYFIENESGYWHVSVAARNEEVVGFLVSISQPGSSMIGPGVFKDESIAIACLHRELNFRAGSTMVFLPPCNCRDLIQFAYDVGAKNCEIHFAQSLGPWQPLDGVVMPTFMPETG
jgi:ribosomal protein S18 acetylase RimI-like enzyme